jgi:hypothetical protein
MTRMDGPGDGRFWPVGFYQGAEERGRPWGVDIGDEYRVGITVHGLGANAE